MPYDGRRTDVQGEEEREDHMRGVRKVDGGGVARLPPHDTAWKSTGEALDMDGRGYGVHAGMRKGDGGGVARLPPHDATRNTAKNGRGNGHGRTRPRRGEGGETQTYRLEFPKGGTTEFPVEGCPGRAGTQTAMRVHFWRRHVRDTMNLV